MGIFSDIEKYNDRSAIITEERTICYKELVADADYLANKIGKRCLAFIVCSNTYASLVGYVGFLRNQIVPIMINSSISMEMYEALFSVYKPLYIWQPRGFTARESTYIFENYELVSGDSEDYEIYPELALLLTTSGSTGSPKYVRQSYSNIYSNAMSIIEYLDINENDRAITTLPMSYTYGLSIINSHLISGASIVITEYTILQREFWNLLKVNEVNNFGGVPYTYEMLKKMRFSKMELSSFRYMTQAGGRLSKELQEEFATLCREKGWKLIVMYGQTEATARMSWLPWESVFEKKGSIGIAIPNGRFRIVDENMNEISEPGKVGELVYEGPNVTLGYATSPDDLKLGDERKGILETGDMAYFDDEGFYYIAGRKKRFLKVFGNRVNLDELESLLSTNGFETVIAGEDNHVKIYTVNDDQAEIITFVSEKTGLNSHAFEAIVIDAIPRNEAGKILYSNLN